MADDNPGQRLRDNATAKIVQDFQAWQKANPSGDVNGYMKEKQLSPLGKQVLSNWAKQQQMKEIGE